MSLQWDCRPFSRLEAHTLYQLLKLRVDVFVVEQQCPYPELDGQDLLPGVRHLMGRRTADGSLAAYLRILPPGLVFPEAGLGRFVVAPSCRGRGLAHEMILQAVSETWQRWPDSDLRIRAQVYLKPFYASHGFRSISGEYAEDGILHVDMRRSPGIPENI